MSLNIMALIPARSGSQRIKDKNIRLLAGKPLIAYTIEAALKCSLIDRVIVSTDSQRIADIARDCGAEVPFLRPSELSASASTEFEFHKHALTWLAKHEDYVPDLIVNLYPTSPFRSWESISAALQKVMEHPEADGLRSTRPVAEHPYKMWVKNGDYLEPYVRSISLDSHTKPYHMLPPIQIQNASIYIIKSSALDRYNGTIGEKMLSFEMSEQESIDINTHLDFLVAETLMNEG